MTYCKVALFCLALMAAGPCLAQAPAAAPSSSAPAAASAAPASAASTPSSASTTASTTTSSAADELSPDLIKKARREGYKPEKEKNGETLFCYKDASTGTRFETKKCVKPEELEVVIHARQDQRDMLSHQGACVGSNCSGR